MNNPTETYESYMVPVLFAPWASRLIQTANIQPNDRVLDVGCGTGIMSPLIGTDVNLREELLALILVPIC
jgi:predicted TPR repeat methyltransferase